MKTSDALSVVGDYTSDQWGMITTAQATAAGIDSVTLYRLADAGHLEPVRRGVYAVAAAPVSQDRDVQAAWLMLNPSVPAWTRPKLDPHGGVVSHRTAASVHELGDTLVERIELTVPRRRTSRDPHVQLRQRTLTEADVTLVDGLPVTTAVRTIEDLLADHLDGSHVAAAIKDGVQAGKLDLAALGDRIGAYARRYGVKSRDGHRLVDHLLDQIGTTPSALVRAPGRATVPLMQLSLLSPQLRETLNRMHSPALQQLAGLTGMQTAALAGLADQLLQPQSGQATLATQLQVPPSNATAALTTGFAERPGLDEAGDTDEEQ